MRFLANGPSIPTELLVARDEGRVVFFCGAGVSRARAGLSDFFGLARKVTEILGVVPEEPSRRIIEEAKETERRTGIGGLIPADRVFGLLERGFVAKDIETAVGKALKPSPDVDLSAHRIMLDLATGPDGRVRLVTTNFDTLFESCNTSLACWKPPRLPDPRRLEEFQGVIHLHGHVNSDYTGAAGDGFVLSSSEFGRAYLSEAWATLFMKSILNRYAVVFVGYTADDPPVQYLLEALNFDPTSLREVYAFQAGPADDAQARWAHKGVIPIVYDEAEDHRALWDTLEAWAVRARNPDTWYERVIGMAHRGPEALPPHERGQVAHVISTLYGARKFSAAVDPPPAQWLCVLDSAIRYSRPGHLGRFREKGSYFDPFDAYGLDEDPFPPKIDPNESFAKREVPKGVWDG
ncbi:MAG: SIR2 family protein, partial [Syntrophorhabdales bacterium]